MSGETKLVAVKLTPTEHKAAAELVERGYFDTLSAVLRHGLLHVLKEHRVKEDTLTDIRIERIGHPMRRRKKGEDEAGEGTQPLSGPSDQEP